MSNIQFIWSTGVSLGNLPSIYPMPARLWIPVYAIHQGLEHRASYSVMEYVNLYHYMHWRSWDFERGHGEWRFVLMPTWIDWLFENMYHVLLS